MAIQSSFSGLLNLLKFVRVVEAGSFAEAARRAGTTTSAMSKAIARFEKAHGLRLLHRTTHSLSLTDDGEELLEGARLLLRDAEELEASLDGRTGRGAQGRVRVSVPGALARACIVPYLPEFHARFPNVVLDLSFEDAMVDLAAEGVDLALRMGRIDGQPGMVARQLSTYPLVLCAAPSYLARKGIPRTPGELLAHDQVAFRHQGTGQVWIWHFADPVNLGNIIRHVPLPNIIVDDGSTGWRLMREGLGVTWAPSWLGLDDLRSGTVVEILPEWRTPEVPLSIVRLDRRYTPQRTLAVLEFIEEIASNWGLDTNLIGGN